jgi:hypothetical protein
VVPWDGLYSPHWRTMKQAVIVASRGSSTQLNPEFEELRYCGTGAFTTVPFLTRPLFSILPRDHTVSNSSSSLRGVFTGHGHFFACCSHGGVERRLQWSIEAVTQVPHPDRLPKMPPVLGDATQQYGYSQYIHLSPKTPKPQHHGQLGCYTTPNIPRTNPSRFSETLQAYTSVGEQLQYCIDFEGSRVAMARRKLDKDEDEDETATRNGSGRKPEGERSQNREQ